MYARRITALVALFALVLTAAVPPAYSQSVVRVARGIATGDVFVLQNKAVVLESTTPFAEIAIAQPGIALAQAISNQTIYILGVAPGETTLSIFGEGNRLITNIDIRVGPDLNEFKARLGALLPGEPIEVRTAGAGIVLSGTVSGKLKIDKAMALARQYAGDNVTNMMTVGGTQQVMLKVRIAEIDRSALKDLGINLSGAVNTGNVQAGSASGPDTTLSNAGGDLTATTNTDGFFDLFFTGAFGALQLGVSVDALEQKGFARLLAEPNIVALSGQQARFLAGGEFPIPVIGDDNEVTIEFKPIGVSLNFVPLVVDEDLINLQLSTEVSSIDPTIVITNGGFTFNGFSVRRAETTIELRDGQSFAIAGLLQDSFDDSISQVPWLGDVPVLGSLFRSVNYQRNQSELVIMVTAYLVTPVDDESQIALPTDRVRIPNEAELFLLGTTELPANLRDIASQGFDGDFGYVLE